jgi:hypothetical protein
VLEELLEALQISDSVSEVASENEESSTEESDTEEMMKLSVHAVAGTTSRRSMRLQGVVGKHTVLILIDSGSSSNFVSQQLATKLQWQTTDIPVAQVSVAGGGKIQCSQMLPAVTWHTQGHKFTTDLKILPLTAYDIILGMDWLEKQNNGKMWINWKRKTMRFKHEGSTITLRGVQPQGESCTAMSAQALAALIKKGEVHQMLELYHIGDGIVSMVDTTPPSIQQVVDQYSTLFEEPTTLPPPRKFDTIFL